MILENGVVRTMDPALPLARALALAGDRIAGGVGTHETALPSPEVIDLGGRSVLPGFSDSHVHFPTWSLARRDVTLDGASSVAECLERVRAHPRHGDWIRGTGWRSATWEIQPTRQALDEVAGSTPVALWAKDYHSLWLNSAALALAEGDLEVHGGVVERDEKGEPTGVLREESAWGFRARFGAVSDDEWVDATREGMRIANARGVVAVHDKDGWLGAPRIFQRLAEHDGLTLRVWQSLPYERLPELEAVGLRSRLGDDYLRIGYLKVFMDGTLGSQTARMLDGSGVQITSGEELADIVSRAARAGWPVGVHAIGDLANREALDAFESTKEVWAPLGLRQRVEHAQCLADEDIGRFTEIDVAWRSRRPLLGRASRRRLRLPLAARLGRAPRERLGRAGRGARSARRAPGRSAADDRRAARVASGAGAHDRRRASRRDRQPRLARGRRAAARQARSGIPRRPRRALA
ncbi:MAG: hypothetical protein E6G28_07895 [Actinobacteria bacterium]|nr:MAG: hypothetical protein E6G28_07895 [Actinomycetota bacterium]